MSKDWKGNDKSIYKIMGSSRYANDADRETNDYYATEPLAVELLLEQETFDKNVWECACGGLSMSNVLADNGYKVRNSDILQRGNPDIEVVDFLTSEPNSWNGDIITNPPYSIAQQFVEKAMETVTDGHKVAMFLKLTFLEGKSRKSMFQKYPPKVLYVSSSRLKCAKNGNFNNIGSGAVAYGWYVWEKGYTGDTTIKWIN